MVSKVLLVGAGAREHAIAENLKRSGAEIYAVMKHRNPGIARIAEEYVVGNHDSPEFVRNLKWVKNRMVDIAFVGPEVPLINGMADALMSEEVPVVGPTRAAAEIEGSKAFMRDLMQRHGIEGAVEYRIFEDAKEVKKFLLDFDRPFVVKPVGVTGGKGVWVMGEHFKTPEEGADYAVNIIENGIGGTKKVLIEEKLVGEEFTLQVFTDGKNAVPMPLVQDFKRAYEGDKGPNTGGMGSYSMENHLLPFVDENEYEKALKILKEIIEAMRKEGREYRGIMYGQFMLTANGPKVVEVNCRFGDPEAMNVLSILDSNLVDIGYSIVNGTLKNDVSFENMATVVKYIVPEGYGTSSVADGQVISVNERKIQSVGANVYYASVHEKDGNLYTTTSRAVAIVGIGKTVEDAESVAERGLEFVSGKVYFRRDIAKKEVLENKVRKMKELRGLV